MEVTLHELSRNPALLILPSFPQDDASSTTD
jgi:hypothetical protein